LNKNFYFIRFKEGGLCLDVYGSQTTGNYINWPCHKGNNQAWRLRYNSNDGTYTFQSNVNNQVMDVENGWTHDGPHIRNWDNNETDAQRFYIERTQNCRFYTIVNKSQENVLLLKIHLLMVLS